MKLPGTLAGSSGMALPAVLVYSLVLAMLVHATLRLGSLEARSARALQDAVQARNYAEALLELLAHRAAARLREGGAGCPASQYCAADFPEVERLIERAPAAWAVEPGLEPLAAPFLPRQDGNLASSVSSYTFQALEARVTLAGPAPIALALGFAVATDSP